jgi:hypothetical protein
MSPSTQPLERAVELFAIVQLLVVGLSHVAQPRPWAEFFIGLRARGEAGVFVAGFLSLIFGSVVVALHPVYRGLPLILTLFGWAQVAKGALYFVAPAVGLRALGSVSLERAGRFRAAGWALLALAAILGWHLVSS